MATPAGIPTLFESTRGGIGGFIKGALIGAATGAIVGAAIAAAVTFSAGIAPSTLLLAAAWGAFLMAPIGAATGTGSGVAQSYRAAGPRPLLPDDLSEAVQMSHEQGIELGHYVARAQREARKHPSFRDRIRGQQAKTQDQTVRR